jgi:hypothetical protein
LIARIEHRHENVANADSTSDFGCIMSPRQANTFDSVSKKWLALVERRKQFFIDLCDSGRWKHYYDTQDELREEMRKVILLRSLWVKVVKDLPDNNAPPHVYEEPLAAFAD